MNLTQAASRQQPSLFCSRLTASRWSPENSFSVLHAVCQEQESDFFIKKCSASLEGAVWSLIQNYSFLLVSPPRTVLQYNVVLLLIVFVLDVVCRAFYKSSTVYGEDWNYKTFYPRQSFSRNETESQWLCCFGSLCALTHIALYLNYKLIQLIKQGVMILFWGISSHTRVDIAAWSHWALP